MLDYKISIIANPEGQAWDFAIGVYEHIKKRIAEDSPELLKENIEEYIELNPLEVRYFPDGEFETKISKNVRRRNCVFIHDANLDPSVWSKQLSLVNKTLRLSSPHYSITIGNYWKWARQDRKTESRVPISAKDDGENIERDHMGVVTVEVHNETIEGFFNFPFDNLPFFPVLYNYLKAHEPEILEDLVFVGPDAGAIKRNRRFIKNLGMDIAEIDKYRKISGELGETLGILGAEFVKNRKALLFDDIVSTGETQKNGALALRNAKAKKVYGCVPHGLFVNGIENVVKPFDLFFLGNTIKQPLIPGEGVLVSKHVLNSLPREIRKKLPDKEYIFFSDILKTQSYYENFTLPSNVRIVPLEPLIGETVYRIYTGKSVSALYDLSNENSIY